MNKIALVFPGQGAQYVGMGRELYEGYPYARDTIEQANDVLGYNLKKTIFEGPIEELAKTTITQPAIYSVSSLTLKVFNNEYKFDYNMAYFAGHSLGEYSALYTAGVFDFVSGLKLVKSRAEFIQKASDMNPGTMAAILGLESGKLKDICDEVSKCFGTVEVVNFNSPGQIVISGVVQAVKEVVKVVSSQGAVKSVILSVSGPFHSSLMTPASELMLKELDRVEINNPRGNFISNCDAEITKNPDKIKENLVKQINHPVLWEKTVSKMISEGVTVFIEIGPGRVLSGLIRRIDKKARVLNIEDKKSLENTIKQLTVQ